MEIAILHVGDLKNLALGGVDQYVKNIIRNRGDNNIILYGTCVSGEYELGKEYEIVNDTLQYKFIPISDDKVRPLTKGYIRNEIKYLKRISDADIIYAQRIELTLPFIFYHKSWNKIVQIIHGSSYYTTLHWSKWKSIVYGIAEKQSIKIARETFVVLMRKEYGVPYYKKKYKKYSDKISYAKIPVDTKIFNTRDKIYCRRKLGLLTDKFIIMYGGRVENDPKRVFLLPEILKRLNSDSDSDYYHLVVVGGGNDLTKLHNKLQSQNATNTYSIIGYTENRNDFVDYLNASDVNINISEFEGTCTSSLEAIACGTRIISTDVGDIRLFIVDGKDGYIIENDEETIVESCVNAINEIRSFNHNKSNLYKNYECETVVEELLQRFQSLSE